MEITLHNTFGGEPLLAFREDKNGGVLVSFDENEVETVIASYPHTGSAQDIAAWAHAVASALESRIRMNARNI